MHGPYITRGHRTAVSWFMSCPPQGHWQLHFWPRRGGIRIRIRSWPKLFTPNLCHKINCPTQSNKNKGRPGLGGNRKPGIRSIYIEGISGVALIRGGGAVLHNFPTRWTVSEPPLTRQDCRRRRVMKRSPDHPVTRSLGHSAAVFVLVLWHLKDYSGRDMGANLAVTSCDFPPDSCASCPACVSAIQFFLPFDSLRFWFCGASKRGQWLV